MARVNIEGKEIEMNNEDFLTWVPLNPAPEKFDNDQSELQVTGVWSTVFRPLGTEDYFADGPFIEVDSYVEALENQEDKLNLEYGVTTRIEYGIRENNEVNTSWPTYEYGVLAEWDVARAFDKCKNIVADYIHNANQYFFWDGKTEPKN